MRRLLPLLLAACGATDGPPPAPSTLGDARAAFPTALELHASIARSCGPSSGACHNNREYPDLHTPRNLLAAIDAPCNPGEEDVFDGCEPVPDELVAGDFRAAIAVFGGEEWDNEAHALFRRFALDAPAPSTIDGGPVRVERGGNLVLVLDGHVTLEAGAHIGRIRDVHRLEFRTLEDVRAGDANRNGVIGAHDPWALITSGRVERSYLVGRLLGTVPGDRMPLANQPLSELEMAALYCWIETLRPGGDVTDPIEYDRCE